MSDETQTDAGIMVLEMALEGLRYALDNPDHGHNADLKRINDQRQRTIDTINTKTRQADEIEATLAKLRGGE